MSIDGRWEISIASPMGNQTATGEFKSQGSTLTGVMQTDQGAVEITDGKVDGDKISWSTKITSPMKITIKVSATVKGDTLEGKAKAGIMPGATLTGKRIG